ncbi:MAG: cytochrome c [Deltaproteobacteria bacterium]|nr:cytochrome c [Deltaproteobacteria bacterium]
MTCDACPTGLVGDGRICVEGTETPAEVYASTCASCHGVSGEGGSAASLNGSYVRPVLFGQVATMPPGSTGPDCGGPSPCTAGMVDYILNTFATEIPGDNEGGQNNATGFAGAVLLSPAQTLRKAALLFARRYPGTSELEGVDESNIRS